MKNKTSFFARLFTAAAVNTSIILAPIAVAHAQTREIGRVPTDATGNDIVLRSLADPKVQGVTCHLTNFERGTLSRVLGFINGRDPFTDPSNTSIACRQTGPITITGINLTAQGEDIFSERNSLVFRHIGVHRFYDICANTLVYVSSSRRVIDGSAKQSVSTVPLYGQNVTWATPQPACR